MCKINSTATVDGDSVIIESRCEEHGDGPTSTIPLAQLDAFLDDGLFYAVVGAIPTEVFSSVVSALEDAGLNVDSRYKL